MSHPREVFRFCPVCGGGLTEKQLKKDEPARSVCTSCGHVLYLDPKVVACTVVELDGRVLLLKRAVEPEIGKWVLPGGYVDRGEELQAAAIRETEEEAGLRVATDGLLGVYSYSGKIPVVVVYLAHPLSGKLRTNEECLEAALFAYEEIPWRQLAFQSTYDALREYYRRRPTVRIRQHE
jgi:ADP-ribose pyrophosphatase YjhB (NUDIX family)